MLVRKSSKRLLSIVTAVVCFFAAAVPALAGEEIDLGRSGSVSVSIKAYATDDAVGGGSLNLYHVADTTVTGTEGAVYNYTEEFSGCSGELLSEDKIVLAQTADTFAKWAEEKEIKAEAAASVNADGKAYFADLSCGLYMITQNTPAEGFRAINSFLVSVPLKEDGVWIYDVDATPKASPVTKITPPKQEEPKTTHTEPTNPDGSSKTTSANGGRTGDNNWFLYGVLVITAVVVISAVLRRRIRRAAQ